MANFLKIGVITSIIILLVVGMSGCIIPGGDENLSSPIPIPTVAPTMAPQAMDDNATTMNQTKITTNTPISNLSNSTSSASSNMEAGVLLFYPPIVFALKGYLGGFIYFSAIIAAILLFLFYFFGIRTRHK